MKGTIRRVAAINILVLFLPCQSGAKETEVRKKFSSILKSYGLGGSWETGTGPDLAHQSKTVFKDKARGPSI
jgi:hypothetical protein